MNKKNILVLIASMILGYGANAQVNLQSDAQTTITYQNPFLDASGYNSFPNNQGKGLLFPRTDLTSWEFIKDQLGMYNNFKTAFDGMIVYNTGTGNTISDPAKGGIQVAVEPGFYYFSNPTADPNDNFGGGSTDISQGKWVRLGSGAAPAGADYKADEVDTGDNFFVNATTSYPVKRRMIEVTFNGSTYTNVTSQNINENTVFLRTQLIDVATGRNVLASAEFKPNSGAEFGATSTDDFFIAKYGAMSTTLDGTYRLIMEYYVAP